MYAQFPTSFVCLEIGEIIPAMGVQLPVLLPFLQNRERFWRHLRIFGQQSLCCRVPRNFFNVTNKC